VAKPPPPEQAAVGTIEVEWLKYGLFNEWFVLR
jgi:hypothetical protein